MPINFETPEGYYDENGIFHQNTALIPSPVPNWSYTTPIDSTKGYDVLPVYTGLTWKDVASEVQSVNLKVSGWKVPTIPDITGQFVGGATSALTMGTIMPFALGVAALYIYRKPIGKLIK